jgi:hypothetical protein
MGMSAFSSDHATPVWAFKTGPKSPIAVPDVDRDTDNRLGKTRIRCPLCDWQPSTGSMWACVSEGTPEPFFGGCGTVWNTFATRGRCPGCSHQWTWTSCLRCHGWSLHVDWYEVTSDH